MGTSQTELVLDARGQSPVPIAEDRSYELPQFLRAERLGKIAVDANLFSPLPLSCLICCGKEHDASVGAPRVRANIPTDFDAVDPARKHQVEEDQVWGLAPDLIESARSVGSLDKIILSTAEREGYQPSEIGVIIDNEYSGVRHTLISLVTDRGWSEAQGRARKDEPCTAW